MEVLNSKNKQKQTDTQMSSDSDEFNSFLFWREPLPSIDDSLLDLLVSSRKIHINCFSFGAILDSDWPTAAGPDCVTAVDWLL